MMLMIMIMTTMTMLNLKDEYVFPRYTDCSQQKLYNQRTEQNIYSICFQARHNSQYKTITVGRRNMHMVAPYHPDSWPGDNFPVTVHPLES